MRVVPISDFFVLGKLLTTDPSDKVGRYCYLIVLIIALKYLGGSGLLNQASTGKIS